MTLIASGQELDSLDSQMPSAPVQIDVLSQDSLGMM